MMNYTEVKYQPEKSKTYLGSPSIVRLNDGALVCSHDYFGELRTLEGENGLTSVYRSEDNGQTWTNITHIMNAWWGTLLALPNALYHIGMTRDYGDLVIRRSNDGGYTWSVPRDERTGVLIKGTPDGLPHQYRIETSGTELIHNGRVYRTFDWHPLSPDGPEWSAEKFEAGVMSADVTANLLEASSWTISNRVKFEPTKVGDPTLAKPGNGWLEGTVTVGPDGHLYDLMRMHLQKPNKAAILSLSDDGRQLDFNYSDGIIDFIGGASRFTVRRDPKTGLYVTFSNYVTEDEDYPTIRNLLCMAVSEDLRHWRRVHDVCTDESGLEPKYSCQLTGFQYPAWQFDGDNDIILLVRTAYRGAHTFHDSNRLTFHFLKDFRKWL